MFAFIDMPHLIHNIIIFTFHFYIAIHHNNNTKAYNT
jgi:hypothetical protein